MAVQTILPGLGAALCALAIGGCGVDDRLNAWREGRSAPRTAAVPVMASAPDSQRVLVVVNSASSASREVGSHYRARRSIPSANIVVVNVPEREEIPEELYRTAIEGPVRQAAQRSRTPIDFIVTTKGVPIRLNDANGYSVDARLAAMDLPIRNIDDLNRDIRQAANPYFGSKERFSRARFGFRLVSRLDGYTVADAKALVDNSLAARPEKGPFFFDEAENRRDPAYAPIQNGLSRADAALKAKGFETILETTGRFVAPETPLMGYAGWGSNDGAFDLGTYRRLKFRPGALAETFVSTSGRTFLPTEGGQSLIADLIRQGVTGVKGYVSEPYTFALAVPDILFDRYTSGFNLAESFYAASPVLRWKDVVIGDPLCRPYGR
ncbi:MAG: TIGR03790 family protein [Fimbriimonadaceae bacterium]|nr:TIGR03790 family protein [Fimbriimonadaceae bacterium]